jgi:hypothetical protein
MKSRQNLSAFGAFFKAFFTTSLISIIICGCAFLYFNYYDKSAAEANTPSQIEILPGAEEKLSLLLVIDDKAFIKIAYAPADEELSFEGISNMRTFDQGLSKGTISEIAERRGYPAAAECVSADRYAYFSPNNFYAFCEFSGDFSFDLPKEVAFYDKDTQKILALTAGLQTLDARRMCGVIAELYAHKEQDLRDYLMGKTQDDSENQKIIAEMMSAMAKAKLNSDFGKTFEKFISLADTDISAYDYEVRHSGFGKLINMNKLKFTVKEVEK